MSVRLGLRFVVDFGVCFCFRVVFGLGVWGFEINALFCVPWVCFFGVMFCEFGGCGTVMLRILVLCGHFVGFLSEGFR